MAGLDAPRLRRPRPLIIWPLSGSPGSPLCGRQRLRPSSWSASRFLCGGIGLCGRHLQGYLVSVVVDTRKVKVAVPVRGYQTRATNKATILQIETSPWDSLVAILLADTGSSSLSPLQRRCTPAMLSHLVLVDVVGRCRGWWRHGGVGAAPNKCPACCTLLCVMCCDLSSPL